MPQDAFLPLPYVGEGRGEGGFVFSVVVAAPSQHSHAPDSARNQRFLRAFPEKPKLDTSRR